VHFVSDVLALRVACRIANAIVVVASGEYDLGDRANEELNLSRGRQTMASIIEAGVNLADDALNKYELVWAEGYGPLELVKGVVLVGRQMPYVKCFPRRNPRSESIIQTGLLQDRDLGSAQESHRPEDRTAIRE